MKKGLMNNWGLKILSFLLAVMLWTIVVNIDDPVTTKTFNNIPVTVINTEVLAATNQTYQIEDGTQNVSVTVRAKRSVLGKIKSDQIKATADMKELTLQTQIPIDIEIEGISYEDVEVTPRNLQVKLEDEETKKFPIVPKTTGTVRDGCALGEIQAVPEMVSIRGPKSVIDSISKVEASFSVSGLSEDVVTKSELVLYDKDNNIIDQSLLANNLGTEGVSVSVQVLETKNVKVEFDTSEITAAAGYSISNIKYEPDHINVTGRSEDLKKLKKISIPASALSSMSGLTSKTEQVVDIAEYLPEDIKLTDENAGSVVVTVGIDKDGSKSYDISMGSIKVNNLSNRLSLNYESADVLEIQIRGSEDALNSYKINDHVSIDLKNYQTAGTFTVPVTVEVPNGCVLENTVSVNVVLEEK